MKIKNLQEYESLLLSCKAELESKEFIKENGIKRSDVEMFTGPGKPYFGVSKEFVNWLEANSSKQWVEWNGRIISRSDFIKGKYYGVAMIDYLED